MLGSKNVTPTMEHKNNKEENSNRIFATAITKKHANKIENTKGIVKPIRGA